MADHLGVFGDKNVTIEDLMREQGKNVRKGWLSGDGEVEVWEDGSETKYESISDKDAKRTRDT